MMSAGKKVKEILKEDFVPAKKYGTLTPGKALKIYRELIGLTQAELAKKSGLKQATISSLEHDRVSMGIDRAKALAMALKVHPSTLAFADWDSGFGAA
jgi:transcriptional regulator with XRE-family HTH domain